MIGGVRCAMATKVRMRMRKSGAELIGPILVLAAIKPKRLL